MGAPQNGTATGSLMKGRKNYSRRDAGLAEKTFLYNEQCPLTLCHIVMEGEVPAELAITVASTIHTRHAWVCHLLTQGEGKMWPSSRVRQAHQLKNFLMPCQKPLREAGHMHLPVPDTM